MLLNRQNRSHSIENPGTPINNRTLDYLFNGLPTDAGVQINEQNALTLSSVWACVRILSESIGTLTLDVFERKNDSNDKVELHRVVDLLQRSPNKDSTPYMWKETLQGHLSTYGNGYSAILRDRAGRPKELVNLLPHATTAKRDKKTNKIIYTTIIEGRKHEIDPSNIIHVPGLSYDGIIGYSPIQKHKQSIGLGLAAESYGSRFFGGDAVVQGVIQLPNKLADTTSLEDSWKRAHGGINNKGRIAVLEQGAEYKKIGIPPEDAQFLETRKYTSDDIARIYRIPPHMIGNLEKAHFKNIEHQDIAFLKYTLMAWLIRWEQELNRKLFTVPEARRFFIKFNIEGFLRGDTKSRYEAHAIARNTGFMSINEIRALENMNPIDGGDEYQLKPPGATDVNDGGDGKNKDKGEENSLKISRLVKYVAERLSSKEINSVVKVYDRGGLPDVVAWYGADNKLSEYISDGLGVPLERAEEYVKYSCGRLVADSMDEWKDSRVKDLITLAEKYGE